MITVSQLLFSSFQPRSGCWNQMEKSGDGENRKKNFNCEWANFGAPFLTKVLREFRNENWMLVTETKRHKIKFFCTSTFIHTANPFKQLPFEFMTSLHALSRWSSVDENKSRYCLFSALFFSFSSALFSLLAL